MSNEQINLNSTTPLRPQLDSVFRLGVGLAVAGVALAAAGFFGGMVKAGDSTTAFFQSYVIGFVFWFGVTAGPVALLLLHNTVGGGWGFVLKRQLTAAMGNLPLMALLSVPLVLGVAHVYPWAQPETIKHHPVLIHQQNWLGWMQVPFVIGRLAIYFALLMLMARGMNKLAWSMNAANAEDNTRKLNLMGPPCLVLYVITITFFAVDFVMTITPGFTTSIIGLLTVVGQGLSTFSLLSLLSAHVAAHRPPLSMVPRRYIRDVGNFMLAFTLLWSYMSFGQLVITFSGNQHEEALFYEQRQRGGWQIIGICLVVAHFALPFLSLLSSTVKTSITNLGKLALIILFMRFVDLYYWVVPSTEQGVNFARLPMDVSMPLAMGGLWLAAWSVNMRDKPLLCEADPRLHGAWPLGHHHEHEPIGYEDVDEDALSEAEVA